MVPVFQEQFLFLKFKQHLSNVFSTVTNQPLIPICLFINQ